MNLTFFSKNTERKQSQVPEYSGIVIEFLIFGYEVAFLPLIKSNYTWLKKLLVIILSLTALTCSCDKEKKENKLSLKFQNCTLGGCYINTKSMGTNQQDTVIFSIVNDTLILYYGMFYNCCGNLTNIVKTNENRITIEVTDLSTQACRCQCYYSSDFKFTNFQTGTYTYKILLKDYFSTDFKIFKEGSVYVIKQ